MTLIEAMNDGRYFRRRGQTYYVDFTKDSYTFSREDLLSNDWELESERAIIDREQLEQALIKCMHMGPFYPDVRKIIAKELGFKS